MLVALIMRACSRFTILCVRGAFSATRCSKWCDAACGGSVAVNKPSGYSLYWRRSPQFQQRRRAPLRKCQQCRQLLRLLCAGTTPTCPVPTSTHGPTRTSQHVPPRAMRTQPAWRGSSGAAEATTCATSSGRRELPQQRPASARTRSRAASRGPGHHPLHCPPLPLPRPCPTRRRHQHRPRSHWRSPRTVPRDLGLWRRAAGWPRS
jgi:hypothetical protein